MGHPKLIVVGASAGGVAPLLELASSLPADLNAIVCVVLHVGSQRSILPQLLSKRSALPARHAVDGQVPVAGRIYVAPPDHHLLIGKNALRLSRGPRENHARPAIDPLFRTAALHWRERTIGVVLSGAMDDGTAGLAAIHSSGGCTVVQDPATAFDPAMPQSALANVRVDHCVAPDDMGPLLVRLAAKDNAVRAAAPDIFMHEQAVFEGDRPMDHLSTIGTPVSLGCPECGGGLWELKERAPLRYRCHTGHAYTALSLQAAQEREADHALQASVRALQERAMLLRRLADVAEDTGDARQAAIGREQAQKVQEQVRSLRALIEQDTMTA
jgi:two-component system, chemotaxis family, protein-glutamate methylesterase/glutaminase